MQVGFIGLGTMGASMATNLQKAGYKLVVHDLRQNSATPHLNAGAEWADSPKVLAAQCAGDLHVSARPARGRGCGARIQRAARGDGEG